MRGATGNPIRRHFNGQSTVDLDGDRATGESCTIAHHLFTANGQRKIMIASLRYLDTFAKIDGAWYFAERNLIVDWRRLVRRRVNDGAAAVGQCWAPSPAGPVEPRLT